MPIFKEVEPDYETRSLKKADGKEVKLSGREALKVWVLKTLSLDCARFEYEAYSNRYGNKLKSLFGRPLNANTVNEALKMVSDALMVNEYITGTWGLSGVINNGVLEISGTVDTVYDSIEIREVVRI